MPGVKRYWLTAARTLASTPAPADLHDLKIGGLTSLIDNHAYNDLAVIVKQASGVRRICYDINFVDQLGSDYSGRNTLDLRRRSVGGDLGWGRRTCLGMKHNGGQREYGYY